MLSTSRNQALAAAATCATLLAAAAAAQAPGRRMPARPAPAAAHTATSSGGPAILEGPGGRTALRRWNLRRDPENRGSSLGWQRGGFGGAAVSVPSVISGWAFKGSAGMRNYEGSVAWYRTTFQAPHAGVYALSFQSANFRADVWVDGHPLGSHRGSYLPFEMRSALAAGTHTVVVRIDWRNPAEQAREGFHRTWFNWGGLSGGVEVRPIDQSELSNPTVQTSLIPDSRDAAQATRALERRSPQ